MGAFDKLVPAIIEMAQNVADGKLNRETFQQVLDSVIDDDRQSSERLRREADRLRRNAASATVDQDSGWRPSESDDQVKDLELVIRQARTTAIAALSAPAVEDGPPRELSAWDDINLVSLVDQLRQDRDAWRVRAQGPGNAETRRRERLQHGSVRNALVDALGGAEAVPNGATVFDMIDALRLDRDRYAKMVTEGYDKFGGPKTRERLVKALGPWPVEPLDDKTVFELIDMLELARGRAMESAVKASSPAERDAVEQLQDLLGVENEEADGRDVRELAVDVRAKFVAQQRLLASYRSGLDSQREVLDEIRGELLKALGLKDQAPARDPLEIGPTLGVMRLVMRVTDQLAHYRRA